MIYPSSQNSVVGIKPSIGLVSRNRIIPIAEAQDTAGVIAKNIEDGALVLEVISGYDENDIETKEAENNKEQYTKFLDGNSLENIKISVISSPMLRKEEKDILKRLEKELSDMGAVVKTSFI